MIKTFLSAKLHNLRVTQCDPNYVGSITLDRQWLDLVNIQEYEQVHVWNYSGARIITYVIAGNSGSKDCQLNGSAARHFQKSDQIIVTSFAQSANVINWDPKILCFNENNSVIGNKNIH